MSDDSMEQRIDMGELPVGGVVPTESQIDRINRLIDTGQRSHAGATMLVLGVMPNRVFADPEQSGMDEGKPLDVVEPDHQTRMAGLINAYRLDIGLGPKRAELASTKGDDRLKLEREINRDKRRRDNFMVSGCIACPNHGNCDIEKKGWEDGMREVHPHLKPNGFGIIYETEPMDEMIRRLVSDPVGHCDEANESPQAHATLASVEVMEDISMQEDANFDIRNIHLNKADRALSERNNVNRKAKISSPEKAGRLAEESDDHFEVFASELNQACTLCSHQEDCALASNPVAWEQTKHYARPPKPEWENQVNEVGVGYESREHWRKRREKDPQTPCPPSIKSDDRPKPVPSTPLPDPRLPEAA